MDVGWHYFFYRLLNIKVIKCGLGIHKHDNVIVIKGLKSDLVNISCLLSVLMFLTLD